MDDLYIKLEDILFGDMSKHFMSDSMLAKPYQIKQAFKDAGYILLNTDGCAHFDMTNGICELGHQRKVCDFCGKDFHMSKTEWDVHTPDTPIMTGQEWYDKFKDILDNEAEYDTRDEMRRGVYRNDTITRIAKKVSGIES